MGIFLEKLYSCLSSDPAFVEVSKNYWLTKTTKDVDTEPSEAISEATPSESQAIEQPRQPELGTMSFNTNSILDWPKIIKSSVSASVVTCLACKA